MIDNLKSSIVRIFNHQGNNVIGAGFIIGIGANNKSLITCAHVIKTALGISSDYIEQPPEQLISFDMPFTNKGKILFAKVSSWYPNINNQILDIAILEPTIDLTQPAQAANIVIAEDYDGHEFRAYGFPDGFHGEDRLVKGELQQILSNNLLQCMALNDLGYFIESGFSGTPVYDLQLRAIIGMAVKIDTPASSKIAFIIPVELMVSVIKGAVFEDLRKALKSDNNVSEATINAELSVIREKLFSESLERSESQRRKVVGRHLLDITDYFKNRHSLRKALLKYLKDPDIKIISVVGRGGIGKTSLVNKVLSEVDLTSDATIQIAGVLYFSTRANGVSLERIFIDCSELLGGNEKQKIINLWTDTNISLEEKIVRLLGYLINGVFVFFLDNMEDMLDLDQKITDKDVQLFLDICLRIPNNARIILTSREQVFIAPSTLSFYKEVSISDGLPLRESIEMLRDLDPGGNYGLKYADSEKLKEIAQKVLGLPRGLEIIASILANDPFINLTDLVDDVDLFDRDEFIDLLVSANYKRLSLIERKVLDALAVLEKPSQLVAIDFVLKPFVTGGDTRKALLHLVRTHVVSIDRESKLVSLHPIDKDYIYNLLARSSTQSNYSLINLESNAANYYRQLRLPQDMWHSIQDIGSLLFEFNHLIKAKNFNLASQLVDSIDENYLWRWGYYKRLINMRSLLTENDITIDNRIRNLYSLSLAYYHIAEFLQAIQNAKVALELNPDPKTKNRTLGIMANSYRAIGDNDSALNYYRAAIDIARETSDQQGECIHLSNSGTSYYYQSKYDKASDAFEKALEISKNVIHDKYQEQRALVSLGNINYHIGDFDASFKWLNDALAVANSINSKRVALGALGGLGRVYTFWGDYQKAIEFHVEGLKFAQETGSKDLEGVRYRGLALAYMGLKEYQSAYKNAKLALDIAIEVGARGREHEARAVIAQVLLHLGNIVEAHNHLSIIESFDFPPSNYQVNLLRGICCLRLGNIDEALFAFTKLDNDINYLMSHNKKYPVINFPRSLGSLGLSCLSKIQNEKQNLASTSITLCNEAIRNVNAKGVIEDTISILSEFPQDANAVTEPIRIILSTVL